MTQWMVTGPLQGDHPLDFATARILGPFSTREEAERAAQTIDVGEGERVLIARFEPVQWLGGVPG
jgi:hypothetical protein